MIFSQFQSNFWPIICFMKWESWQTFRGWSTFILDQLWSSFWSIITKVIWINFVITFSQIFDRNCNSEETDRTCQAGPKLVKNWSKVALLTSWSTLTKIRIIFTFCSFIAQIAGSVNSTQRNFHFIGFGIGAHVAGQAAAALKREKNLTVNRLTALDPMEPCFAEAGLPLRLDRSCAEFVDVIHTDSSSEFDLAYGIREPIGWWNFWEFCLLVDELLIFRDVLGHMDFYPNRGVDQPGCYQQTKKPKARSMLDVEALIRHGKILNL